MHNELFAAALGLADPWFVAGLDFGAGGAASRASFATIRYPVARLKPALAAATPVA